MLLAALFMALAPPARADGSSSANAGTSSGAFLKIGPDARAIAMGQAASAAADDATALYWNPANLATIDDFEMSFTHAALFRGMFYDYLAMTLPLERFLGHGRRAIPTDKLAGSVAFGVQYLNAGPLSEVDNTGADTGQTFTPQDMAVTAGWGSSLGPLDLGVSGKYVSSRIRESASTYALDAGARVRFKTDGRPWAIAASVHNLFGKLKFINEAVPLPVRIRTGLSMEPVPGWTLAGDLEFPQDAGTVVALGTEYLQPVGGGWVAAGRIGYNSLTAQSQLETANSLSLGAGIGYHELLLDYAWLPYGILGQTHRLSVTVRF